MSSSLLFEGPDLENVLADARDYFGPSLVIEAANRVRRGGLFGFFASERYEVWARAGSPSEAEEWAGEQDEHDSFSSLLLSVLDRESDDLGTLGAVEDSFFGDGHAGGGGAPSGNAPGIPEPVLAAARAVGADVLDQPRPAISPTAESLWPTETADTAPVVIRATSADVALEDASRGASVFEERDQVAPGLLWKMLDRLEQHPDPPALPRSGPAVVAFVGDATLAVAAVRRIGARAGLWGNDMVVVSRREMEDVPAWSVVADVDGLSARAGRWHQRPTVTPVIVDLPDDVTRRVDVVGALNAIGAEQVRLMTEAWRLPADVGATAARIGGVDAIELVDTTDAVEPLAMMDLDIPIASIEGREASAALLAALWLERKRRG